MNMANRLAALTLSVRDYSTDERAEVRFNGEVVSLDDSGKVNIYRFFETENGTMMVTVDYSKEKIVVREQSETVLLSLELSEDLFGNVSYRIDGNRLDLRSKMKRFETARRFDLHGIRSFRFRRFATSFDLQSGRNSL